MKNILPGLCAVVFCVFLGACVSSGPAPQNVRLESPDGNAVIIKDVYELPRMENKKLGGTEIVKVFFPNIDNVKIKSSMTLLKLLPGISQAKHKQSSSQIIYAISGGGKLLISNNMIILKKGIMVYIPPDAIMSITNNVNKMLELVVVTYPPFEPSQLTILGKAPRKVKVSVDAETTISGDSGDNDIQAVSEKYRTARNKRRSLSVEEYRNRLNEQPLPGSGKKDPLLDLLDIPENPKPKTPGWPLKMPDSSKIPLTTLKDEQLDKLMPPKAQKIENTKLKPVQALSPKEQVTPIYDKAEQPGIDSKTSKINQDSPDKLLKDQKKYEEKLIPGKVLKAKKTSLKHVQELSPQERGVVVSDKKVKQPGIDSKTSIDDQDSLEKLLRDQKKRDVKLISGKPVKAKKTASNMFSN